MSKRAKNPARKNPVRKTTARKNSARPAHEPLAFPLVLVRPAHQADGADDDGAQARRDAEAAAILEVIQRMAAAQFDPGDIAIVAEIPAADMKGGDELATKAYNRGRLEAQYRVRNMLLKMAEAGSSPAQKMILDIAEAVKARASDDAGATTGPAANELAVVREHLAALELGTPEASTAELARLAVARIIELESQRQ